MEYIADMASDTIPRRHLDSVIRILVTICIDLNDQMQTAQQTIGAMSEMIEDMLGCGEEVKKLSAQNKRLKKVIDELRKQLNHWDRLNKNLAEFSRPEGMQRDAVKELGEMKIMKEDLEKQVTKLRNALKVRNEEYELAYEWKEKRKKEVETLKKKVDLAEEIREAESTKFTKDLILERKRVKSERTEKKKLKEEISIIRDLNEDNLRKI